MADSSPLQAICECIPCISQPTDSRYFTRNFPGINTLQLKSTHNTSRIKTLRKKLRGGGVGLSAQTCCPSTASRTALQTPRSPWEMTACTLPHRSQTTLKSQKPLQQTTSTSAVFLPRETIPIRASAWQEYLWTTNHAATLNK